MWVTFVGVAMTVLIAAACSDSPTSGTPGTREPTAAPTGEASAAPTAMTVGTSEDFAVQIAGDARAAGGANAEAAVEAALAALAEGDADALGELLLLQSSPCVVSRGTVFPPCEAGQEAGTVVSFIPAADPTLAWGFLEATLPVILEEVYGANPATLMVAGRAGSEPDHWYLAYELSEQRDGPAEAYWAAVARWITIEIDPAGVNPVVAISWGDTDPLSMYRLWDPGLAEAVYIDAVAVEAEQAIHEPTGE